MMNTNETNIPSELSIAIVDDHEVVLEGLYSFLKKNGQKNVQAFSSAHDLLRQAQKLREIARGLSTKEIAARLYISENTVETHRQSLFAKLQAHNMADLMVKAIAQGYINPHDIASTL